MLNKNKKLLAPNAEQRMLYKSYYFVSIPLPILHDKNLKVNDKIIFGNIFTMLLEGNIFFKSNRQIGKELNMSPQTVSRSMSRLINGNYVTVKYGKKHTSNYNKRYITQINIKKLGKPDKKSYIKKHKKIIKNAYKKAKHSNKKNRKHNIKEQRKIKNSSSYNKKVYQSLPDKLQYKITDAFKSIRKYGRSYADTSISNGLLNEYTNSKFNLDNVNQADILYKYNRLINHIHFHSDIGIFCYFTRLVTNSLKDKIKKYKNKLVEYFKNNKSKNEEKEQFGDYGYPDF